MECPRCGSSEIQVTRTKRGEKVDLRECICRVCKLTFETETKIVKVFRYVRARLASIAVDVREYERELLT